MLARDFREQLGLVDLRMHACFGAVLEAKDVDMGWVHQWMQWESVPDAAIIEEHGRVCCLAVRLA